MSGQNWRNLSSGLDDRPSILVVVDAELRAKFLAYARSEATIRYLFTTSIDHAFRKVNRDRPDLVVLKKTNGSDVLLKALASLHCASRSKTLPIVLLTDTVKESHTDFPGILVQAVFPIDINIDLLMSRVRAILRRTRPGKQRNTYRVGNLTLEESSYRVEIDGVPVVLRPLEYQILAAMIERPNYVWSRSELLDHVWGQHANIEPRSVDRCIGRIRQALAREGAALLVESIVGIGYRFQPFASGADPDAKGSSNIAGEVYRYPSDGHIPDDPPLRRR